MTEDWEDGYKAGKEFQMVRIKRIIKRQFVFNNTTLQELLEMIDKEVKTE